MYNLEEFPRFTNFIHRGTFELQTFSIKQWFTKPLSNKTKKDPC